MQADTVAALIAAKVAERSANLSLIAALIATASTMIVSVISGRANRRLQTDMKAIENDASQRLKVLESRLTEERSAADAEREYIYDARKRLYRECEPLLFRLGEAAENCMHRVISLARTARDGELEPGARSWLSRPGYYMASTIYNLLAPAVVFRLLQERLTLVDLAVDARIQTHYLLAKLTYLSWTEDFALANTSPRLSYAPFDERMPEKRKTEQAVYWRQGTNVGWVDKAVEALIEDSPTGRRLSSFGRFEAAFDNDLRSSDSVFAPFADLFDDFHPRTRPVLWRVLVMMSVECRYLLVALKDRPSQDLMFSSVRSPEEFAPLLDWRRGKELETYDAVEPLRAADVYLEARYPQLVKHVSRPLTASN